MVLTLLMRPFFLGICGPVIWRNAGTATRCAVLVVFSIIALVFAAKGFTDQRLCGGGARGLGTGRHFLHCGCPAAG